MKILLVNGQVIRQQIWISFNDRSRAIDVRSLIKSGYPSLRHCLFSTVTEDGECIWTEELTLKDLMYLLRVFVAYQVAKTSLSLRI